MGLGVAVVNLLLKDTGVHRLLPKDESRVFFFLNSVGELCDSAGVWGECGRRESRMTYRSFPFVCVFPTSDMCANVLGKIIDGRFAQVQGSDAVESQHEKDILAVVLVVNQNPVVWNRCFFEVPKNRLVHGIL